MTTELVLLGTAAAPMPVAGRAGISSALVVDDRVFVIDCGRGSPSSFVDCGLDFTRLEAVFLTHLHADHVGDLPGMILYPWGIREDAEDFRYHLSASMVRRHRKLSRPAMLFSIVRPRSSRRSRSPALRTWSPPSSRATHTT